MTRKKSIQFKALFLLIVFSLNTVIGFACAVGLDMGFNSHHHDANLENHQTKKDKDNCCNGEVMRFQKLDKALSFSINIINPVFFTSFVTTFFNIGILSSSTEISGTKYFVRSHHPPIPDIRIAIRSFQI